MPPRPLSGCPDGQEPALGAYNVAIGEPLWMYCSGEQTWRTLFAITDAVAYVEMQAPYSDAGGNDQQLVAVDAHTGVELWRYADTYSQLQWPLGPFTGAGIIVLPVKDGSSNTLVGLDAATGQVRWQIGADNDPSTVMTTVPGQRCYPQCVEMPPDVYAPAANTDTTVVVAGSMGAGVVRGLNRTTGEQLWTTDLHLADQSGVVTFRGATAVDGDLVIIPTAATMVALDATTGKQRWQAPRLDHPVAAHGYVIGGVPGNITSPTQNSQSRVLDSATGTEVVALDGFQSYGEIWAIAAEAVYLDDIRDNGPPDVVAYELPSGSERWRQPARLGDPQQAVGDNVIVRSRGTWRCSTVPTDQCCGWSARPPTPQAESATPWRTLSVVFITFDALPPAD